MISNLPAVKTNKFILRDLNVRDYLDLYQIGSDYENTRYVSWGPFSSESEAYNFINKIIIDRINQGLHVGYSIVDSRTNKMIGMIDFHTYYPSINCAEVGFILNKMYWNKGYITKALKELIKIGFEYMGLNKILIGHMEENEASRRVIEKCDFKYERTEYNAITDKETKMLSNIIYYSIFKEDYERGMLKWQ